MSQLDSEPPTIHSQRTLHLRYNIPISKTHQFWDSLKDGKFITTRCKDCGEVSFPPQADCPVCMSSNSEWVDLGTEAELVTFTYVQITPTSFVDSGPYHVAVGVLPNGLKVLAWVEGATTAELKPGVKLRLEARLSDGGSPYYAFVPVK